MTPDKQTWEYEVEQKIREAENEKLLREIARETVVKQESESKESDRDWSGGA